MKKMEWFHKLVRPDLNKFVPYKNGIGNNEKMILLNANEASYCPVRSGSLNRYPDPVQKNLKRELSKMFNLQEDRLFTGNGSDEIIDLIIRGFCFPGRDLIGVLTPAYGMYAASAILNGAGVVSIPLDRQFRPDILRILRMGKRVKVLFVCSPNNPTGNLFRRELLQDLIHSFPGLVVLDEAYIDFSGDPGLISSVPEFSNLLVLRTLSKGWGLAGARIGVLAGDPVFVRFLNSIKLPYNMAGPSIDAAMKALSRKRFQQMSVDRLITLRESLADGLKKIKEVRRVYPSDANFLLVKFRSGTRVFRHLYEKGILVRDVSSLPGCGDCLRITVGMKRENKKLLKILTEYRRKE